MARRPALLRLATLLAAGDEHLAEDLVQTALTRLYVAWRRVERDQGPEAYARRILVNARGRRAAPAVAAQRDQPGRPARGRRGPPARPRTATPSRSALAALGPRMRAAVVLRHWLGYDVAECAALLGCSEGTVKSQTARGLDRLRALLSDDLTLAHHVSGS